LRAAASDSLDLSLGEDPLGGDGGCGGPWAPSEEDVSVDLELSSSDDVGLDPEAELSEDEECRINNVSSITSVLRPTVAKQ